MTPLPLTRICSSCGLEKPLSAFLQLSNKEQTLYGNICATCRGLGKTDKTFEESGKSTGPSGHRLGAKEKVYLEKEQKRQINDLKELYRQEIKKRDETKDKKLKMTDLIEKNRKVHSQYIESKKQTFLGKKNPSQEKNAEPGTKEYEATVERVKQDEFVRRELQIASLDTQAPFYDSPAALLKYKEGTFLQFKTWLGKSAHLRTTERVYGAKDAGIESTASKEISNEKKEPLRKDKKLELEDYIDKRNESSFKRRK